MDTMPISAQPSRKPNETPQIPGLESAAQAVTEGLDAMRRSLRLRSRFPRMARLCPPRTERFWVVGGDPGNFKTQTLWNLACDMAELRHRVLWVSLEETTGALAVKALARYSRIPVDTLELGLTDEGKLTDEQDAGLVGASERLAKTELYLRMHGAEKHGNKIADVLRSACRTRFDAVFVDHLRMIGRGAGRSKFDVLEEAVDSLRRLARGGVARDYAPFVCAISPLNRDGAKEGDPDRMPRLSDFSGSQQIESDADVAIIVKKRPQPEDSEAPNTVDAFVLKNRHGRAPVVLQFEAQGGIATVTERHRQDSAPQTHWQNGDDE